VVGLSQFWILDFGFWIDGKVVGLSQLFLDFGFWIDGTWLDYLNFRFWILD
jgi:hypothetical protein